MNTVVGTYIAYWVISATITICVAQTLQKNGRHFLVDVFKGNKELANAVNHLLVVGFYLINLGFVSLSLKISDPPTTLEGSIEALSMKIGAVLVIVGIMHMINLFVFNKLRSNAIAGPKPRYYAPQYTHQPQPPQ